MSEAPKTFDEWILSPVAQQELWVASDRSRDAMDEVIWSAGSRAGKKGDRLEDLKKARWYLDRRIAALSQGGRLPAAAGKGSKGEVK